MTNLTASQLTARILDACADGADQDRVDAALQAIADTHLDDAHRLLLDLEADLYL